MGVVRDTRRRGDEPEFDVVRVDLERARLQGPRHRCGCGGDPCRVARHRGDPGDPQGPGASTRSCVGDALLVGAEAFAVHQGNRVALRGHGDHDAPPPRRRGALRDLRRAADAELEAPDRPVGADRASRPQHGDDLQPAPVTARGCGLAPIRSRTGERDRRRDGDDPPAIVAGDFNDADDPTIIDALPGVEHVVPSNSNPSGQPTQLLDHVLLPADAIDVSVGVPAGGTDWAAISDHLPVTVRFTLPIVTTGV